ncbi:hypothetical protein ONA91_37085 [Micromonospora sp. DR5-3]|uniref:hypothetical protein n=1 Tax=unclassified Micromonospora TaxID=2617518 RepID=UPI0011D989DB|nr:MULTISPECIES: hypothetical protein [unclassified Micromonospora]MCW3820061.1 hypothetical protein [Micromonospora sp. DR5-3]TYC19946.1 hypothetical protein FXF52_34005 [Micromonospora sp. MP36]
MGSRSTSPRTRAVALLVSPAAPRSRAARVPVRDGVDLLGARTPGDAGRTAACLGLSAGNDSADPQPPTRQRPPQAPTVPWGRSPAGVPATDAGGSIRCRRPDPAPRGGPSTSDADRDDHATRPPAPARPATSADRTGAARPRGGARAAGGGSNTADQQAT